MKEDRDWIDYTNLASNVASVVQLHSINQALAERSNREETARLEDEREAKLREIVFQTENMIEGLKKEATQKPLATFAVALEIKNSIFGQGEITSASFRAYEDKDRYKKVLNALEAVSEQTAASLTPAEKEDAEKCVKYRAEMPSLEIAISLQQEQEMLSSSKEELDKKTREAAQIKTTPISMPPSVKKYYLGWAIIFLLSIIAVAMWFKSNASDVVLSPLSYALFMIAAFSSVYLSGLEKKRPNLKKDLESYNEQIKHNNELKKRKRILNAEIQELEKPASKFAQNLPEFLEFYELFDRERTILSSEDFIQLRETRMAHIKKVLVEV